VKDWFFGLERRERLMVGVGGALLLWLLLYLMFWKPVADEYSGLKESVAAQRETLTWMQQAAAQIKAFQRSGTNGATGLGGRSLLAVVDQSARAGGLASVIKRIEPDGSKGVKVWLEGAAFDAMILWLGQLDKSYRIEASLITLEPIGEGRVNARLTLLAPAA